MPFDFPNSPTNGQQVTGAAGQIYQWNGTRWVGVVPPGPLPVSSGGSGSTTAAGAPWAEKATSAGNVGRNLIHNPLFNIWQRGPGPFTTNLAFTTDRWKIIFSGGTTSIDQAALNDAAKTAIGDEAAANSIRATIVGGAAAGDFSLIVQSIEDVRRLAGKTVTLSFWAVASAGTPKIGLEFFQIFGTGGSPSTGINVPVTPATISTTWARYTVTVALPTILGKTLGTNNDHRTEFNVWFSAGSSYTARSNIGVQSATFQIWGMQLEIGSTMTPLEKPDPQQDLAKCQRFYQTGYANLSGQAPAGAGIGYFVPFVTTMRAAPTVFLANPSYINANSLAASAVQTVGAMIQAAGTAAGPYVWSCGLQMSADL